MDRQDKHINITEYMGLSYIIKNDDNGKFDAILTSNIMTIFNCENRKEDLEKIDQELCNKIYFYEDVDELVDTAFSCVTTACNAAFKFIERIGAFNYKASCSVVNRRINGVEIEDKRFTEELSENY